MTSADVKGQMQRSYLDGGHLSITPPAEVRELNRVVAKPHWSVIQHGSLLNLKLQVMEVWEVMIWTRSAETGGI